MFTRGTLIYIAQRLVLIVLAVLGVSSLVFLAIHRLPGDALFSEHMHGDQYQQTLHHYGLDRPLWVQYVSYLTGLLHGDLGESLVNRGVPIGPIVFREMSVSAEIGLVALLFTVGIGMTFGVIAAIRQNSWLDYVLSTTSVIGYSMPNFVIATFLILVFGIWLDTLTQGTFYFQIGWPGLRQHRRHLAACLCAWLSVCEHRRPPDAGEHARSDPPGLHTHRTGQGSV